MIFKLLLFCTAIGLTSLASAQMKQDYKAIKTTANGQTVRQFISDQHSVLMEPFNNEGDRLIYLNDVKFRLQIDSKKKTMLYKNDSIVAVFNDGNIVVHDETYRVKAGTNKEWKYLKDGVPTLTCSFEQKQKEKYISLTFDETTTHTDVLTVLALYSGEAVIKQKSAAPYLAGLSTIVFVALFATQH